MILAAIAETFSNGGFSMSKLIWIAAFGLVLAGCASDNRDRSTSTGASGGSTATTAPTGVNEDKRRSQDVAPGDEGNRQRPQGSTAPRSTY